MKAIKYGHSKYSLDEIPEAPRPFSRLRYNSGELIVTFAFASVVRA
jgi:hypothetical protein